MVASAVVGIIINLVTGQRWDKGLLANLFLAWLFRRIGGELMPEGEEPPAGGKTGPSPGGRTTVRVPGLYEGINPTQEVPGFEFEDTVGTSGGEKVVTTKVTASDGSSGTMQRGYNPATGQFVLHYAFLDSIPSNLRWVPTEPEMVSGRGTPLESYMTMRQMKILESETNSSLAVTQPRVVKISTIVNERTIAQLAKAVPKTEPPSAALDTAVMDTHSVQYSKNSITQTGGRIASAHVDGGSLADASTILSPEVMAEFGIKPSDQVLWGFDILLDVVPANAPNAPNAPTPLAPPQVPVPDHDRDKGH
jgi:hypothetical protein